MSQHEIERAYDVATGQELPDPAGWPGVVGVGSTARFELVARYLDVGDLALIRAGITLRRRTGGPDAGWHLKVPAGSGRDEIHHPLGGDDEAVPAPLAAVLLGHTRGRPLVEVATIVTSRASTPLLGPDGVLAEVDDDRVSGRSSHAGDDGSVSWREVEVELTSAPPEWLDDVDGALAAVGIEVRTEQRKVATVLAGELAAARAPSLGKVSKGRSASRVVELRLRRQVAALLAADVDVRRDVPDGVHQLRVSCRRLRGLLASYRPLVRREVTDPVRDELRWVAQSLGAGRDAEVVLDRLRDAVADLSRENPEAVLGPVSARLETTFASRGDAARHDTLALLTGERYLALLGDLEGLVRRPPWTDDDGVDPSAPARDVLPALVRRDFKRLRRRVRAAHDLPPGTERDKQLHEVRKAAKRLRYACETVEPVWGAEAKAMRRAAQEITRVLGERQDGSVTRAALVSLAVDATSAGENGFTYGVLWAREEARVHGLDVAWADVWDAARDRELRAWL